MAALVTTYLQMGSLTEFRPTQVTSDACQVTSEEDWRFNREMYLAVGEKWKWIDKRPWTDEQWQDYASDPNLRTFAGHCGDKVAGYYELRRHPLSLQAMTPAAREEAAANQGDVEIAYFGLLPEFIGRGLGGALLTCAVENAWSWSPTPMRVWVHTCNRDHPSALANYQARGFKIYKVEEEED